MVAVDASSTDSSSRTMHVAGELSVRTHDQRVRASLRSIPRVVAVILHHEAQRLRQRRGRPSHWSSTSDRWAMFVVRSPMRSRSLMILRHRRGDEAQVRRRPAGAARGSSGSRRRARARGWSMAPCRATMTTRARGRCGAARAPPSPTARRESSTRLPSIEQDRLLAGRARSTVHVTRHGHRLRPREGRRGSTEATGDVVLGLLSSGAESEDVLRRAPYSIRRTHGT